MYEHISGELVSVSDGFAIVDVGGLGYHLRIPASTRDALRGRASAHLFTTLRVRDEQLILYGFSTLEERGVFERLLTISGIGAGTALAILSGIPLDEFRAAVSTGQVKVLEQIKGIGRKTAQRVILELKQILVLDDEVDAKPANWTPQGDDAVRALIALGHSPGQAEQSVRRALETLDPDARLEDVIKAAARTVRTHG